MVIHSWIYSSELVTARQRSCGKVIFADTCVRNFICSTGVSHKMWAPGGGEAWNYYSWCISPHCTAPTPPPPWQGTSPYCPWTYNLTVQGPLLVTSGGQYWRPVQTLFTGGAFPPVLTSGGYWSHSNPTGILLQYLSNSNIFKAISVYNRNRVATLQPR